MKLYVMNSHRVTGGEISPSRYGERLLRNLANEPSLCIGCGVRCVRCRDAYEIDFSADIAGTHELPEELPQLIDNPAEYLPAEIPRHDVMIAVNVHEDILLELPRLAEGAGAKALLAPVEDPTWLSPGVQNQLRRTCTELGLEFEAPRPSCSLEEGGHPTLDQFIRHFRIGKPKLKIELNNDTIENIETLRSAPCGNTYFVAHNLVGTKIDEKLPAIIAKYWHSYPCVASMKMDPKTRDTILHEAGHTLRNAFFAAIEESGGVAKPGGGGGLDILSAQH